MNRSEASTKPLCVRPAASAWKRTDKHAPRVENLQGQAAAGARLEQDLRGQGALLRELTENIHQVFWLMSADQRQVFYVSPSYEDIWGQSCDSLLRHPMSWLEAVHPEDRPGIEAQLGRRHGQRFSRQYRIVRPDGTTRWILARGYPVGDQLGRPYRIAGLAEDITERKLAEAKAQELAAIVESSEDAIVSNDFDGTIRTWNRAAERIIGYRAKEVVGQNIALFIPENKLPFEVAHLEELRKGKRIKCQDTIRLKKDGAPLAVSVMISPVKDASGRIVGASKIIRDLSERQRAQEALKESEARYKSLFENMAEGLMYCRMLFKHGRPHDFLYLEVNHAVEKLSGLRNVVGRKVSEVVPGIREANPELFERYGRVAMTGRPERFEFYSVKLERWLSVSAYCPRKEHFVALFHNITARKQAEEALQNSRNQLRSLFARLQSVREQESIRISREIHDELGQTLTRLKMDMLWMERKLSDLAGSPAVNSLLDRVVAATELVDSVTGAVQQIAAELRPAMLDDLGLGPALQSEGRRFQEREGIRCKVRLPKTEVILSSERATGSSGLFGNASPTWRATPAPGR